MDENTIYILLKRVVYSIKVTILLIQCFFTCARVKEQIMQLIRSFFYEKKGYSQHE